MLFSLAERMIALRYLRARRGESFVAVILTFSLIGIALGVATLIVVMSVMNGVRDEMLQHFVGLSGHVHVYGREGSISNYKALAEEIRKIDGVVEATPLIEGQIMLTANGQARGVMVRAMQTLPPYVEEKIMLGGTTRYTHQEGILIGEKLARNLRLLPGHRVTFISPDGRQTVLGLVPRLKAYPVSGVFKFGMSSIDGSVVIMPFAAAQTFFKLADNGENRATGIEVKVHDIDQSAAIAEKIQQRLDPNKYWVTDWRQSNAAIFEALRVQQVVMFLILMMIIIVAAFNIISSLVMLVKDKQRDIAVLRAMGATRGMIQRVFMLSGLAVGMLGTFSGLVLGLLLAFHVDDIRKWVEAQTGQALLGEQLYFLSSLPAKVDALEVTTVVILSLTLSLLATLYPARRAAALNPAEALRYE